MEFVNQKEFNSEQFRLSTKWFLDYIKNNSKFHIIDIENLCGYFLFDFGDDSVLHFHVKGCPNWKFAIWWNMNDNKKVTGEFFCQYEPTIDKFKPSCSSYNRKITRYLNVQDEFASQYDADEIIKVFNFIHKHPLRAWNHDYEGYDYNIKNPSIFRLVYNYIKYKWYDFRKVNVTNICDKIFLRFVNKEIIPWLTYDDCISVEVYDESENVSPRYEIQCKLRDDSEQDTGCFSLWDDTEESKVLKSKWNKLDKRLDKFSKFCGIYRFNCMNEIVLFWKQCERDEYNQEEVND